MLNYFSEAENTQRRAGGTIENTNSKLPIDRNQRDTITFREKLYDTEWRHAWFEYEKSFEN